MSSKHKRAKRLGRMLVFVCLLPAVFLPAGSPAQQGESGQSDQVKTAKCKGHSA